MGLSRLRWAPPIHDRRSLLGEGVRWFRGKLSYIPSSYESLDPDASKVFPLLQ